MDCRVYRKLSIITQSPLDALLSLVVAGDGAKNIYAGIDDVAEVCEVVNP